MCFSFQWIMHRDSDKENFSCVTFFLFFIFLFLFSLLFRQPTRPRSSPFHLQGNKPQFPETFSFYWQERRKRNKAYRLMCGILLCIRLCAKCCTVQISYGRKKKQVKTNKENETVNTIMAQDPPYANSQTGVICAPTPSSLHINRNALSIAKCTILLACRLSETSTFTHTF